MEQLNTLSQENQTKPVPNRPAVITVVCVLCFLGVAFSIPMIFSPLAQQVGSWYPPYLAFSIVAGLVCMLGFWKMKKWGVFAYIALVGINQIVLLTMGVWNVFALLLPLVVVAIGLAHLRKMN